MHAFNQLHREVRPKLTVARRANVLEMLREHQLDIALSGYPPSEGVNAAFHEFVIAHGAGRAGCRVA